MIVSSSLGTGSIGTDQSGWHQLVRTDLGRAVQQLTQESQTQAVAIKQTT